MIRVITALSLETDQCVAGFIAVWSDVSQNRVSSLAAQHGGNVPADAKHNMSSPRILRSDLLVQTLHLSVWSQNQNDSNQQTETFILWSGRRFGSTTSLDSSVMILTSHSSRSLVPLKTLNSNSSQSWLNYKCFTLNSHIFSQILTLTPQIWFLINRTVLS